VFTPTDFDTMTQRMASAPVTSRAGRDYMRVMYAGASSESADKQGRVMIPTALRAYAGLDRDVVVIGANSRVEIWDRPTWDAYLAEKEQTFAELSEEVLPGFM
jgi:MraZ protein